MLTRDSEIADDHHRTDNQTTQRKDDIFMQLALGLIGLRDQVEAERIGAIFADPNSNDTDKHFAHQELREKIIDLRIIPNMPSLGIVLDQAYQFANFSDHEVPGLIQQYVNQFRPLSFATPRDRRTQSPL